MGPSLFLLLALLFLSSSIPLDEGNDSELINDLCDAKNTPMEVKPGLETDPKFRQRRQAQSCRFASSGDDHNLKWVTWNGSLPNDSVSIYNDYVGRTDFVCKYMCHAGFYDPGEGNPHCNYTNQNKELTGFPFEVLVNRDNFEVLEWEDGSYGSVPKGSVTTCPGEDIFVGKNQYGLGKVDSKNKAFYLPWKGSEYWYSSYQVLTVSENIISQEIYDVRFDIDGANILKFPPEVIRKSSIKNEECHPVVKRDTLTKTYQVTQSWDHVFSVTSSVKTTIKFGIPFITSEGIEFGLELTYTFSSGSTVVDTITDSVTVEITAPPNQSCSIEMKRYQSKLSIPFSARLRRTYGNGLIRMTTLTGTYNSVQVGEVQVSLKKCELLGGSKCPESKKEKV